MTNAYSAWLSPSSRYPRILVGLLLFTFAFVIGFGVMRRLGCGNSRGMIGIVIYGQRPIIILAFSIAITFLIPSNFLSMFIWHFAWGPLNKHTNDLSYNQLTNQSIDHSHDQPEYQSVVQSDDQSDDESIKKSSNKQLTLHFDLTSLTSWRDTVVDIKRAFTPDFISRCRKAYQSINQSTEQPIIGQITSQPTNQATVNQSIHITEADDSLGVPMLDARRDPESSSWSSVDVSLDESNNQTISQPINRSLTYSPEHPLYRPIQPSVQPSIHQSVNQINHRSNNQIVSHTSLIPPSNLSVINSVDHSSDHSFKSFTHTRSISQSVNRLPVKPVKQTFVSRSINRLCGLFLLPLVLLTSPRSVYQAIIQNGLIDAISNVLHLLFINLLIGSRGINQYNQSFFQFMFRLTDRLDWLNYVTPWAEAVQCFNEMILLPLYYRAFYRTTSQSINQSINQPVTRSRSVVWIAIILMIGACMIPRFVPVIYEGDDFDCWLCLHVPLIAHLLLDYVAPWTLDIPWYFPVTLFGAVTLILLVDQFRHFFGNTRCSHHRCGCKMLYILLLCLLCAQENGMSLMLRVTTDMVTSINSSDDQANNHYNPITTMLFFYAFSSWWQYLIRMSAYYALPNTSDLAILFPIQLLEDIYSDLMFASLTPFSGWFFFMSIAQATKMFIRDADVLSEAILTCVRKRRGKNQSNKQQSNNQTDAKLISERSYRCRVMRHQNLLIELCAKTVVVAVFITDLIPFGSNPTWMPIGLREVSTHNLTYARLFIVLGMIYLIVMQCGVHLLVLTFIDWREKKQMKAISDQSNNQPINQSINRSLLQPHERWNQLSDIDSISVYSDEDRSLGQSHDHSDHKSSDQSSDHSNNQSNSHSDNQSIDKPTHQQLLNEHWTKHCFFFLICIIRFVPFLLVMISDVLLYAAADESKHTTCVVPVFTNWQLLEKQKTH